MPNDPNDLGLSLDMLDVDRLRTWAEKIETHGPMLTHWASPSFLVDRMRDIATRLETAIHEIGALRESATPQNAEAGSPESARAVGAQDSSSSTTVSSLLVVPQEGQTDDGCTYEAHISRVCRRGTSGCRMHHAASPDTKGDPR